LSLNFAVNSVGLKLIPTIKEMLRVNGTQDWHGKTGGMGIQGESAVKLQ
jgi:hypothetical protein